MTVKSTRNERATEIAMVPAAVIGILVALAGTVYATVHAVQDHAWGILFFAVPEMLGALEGGVAALIIFLAVWPLARFAAQLKRAPAAS